MTYTRLKENPYQVSNGEVKENPREVHFNVISSMCDNKYIISFYRKENGTYVMDTHNHSRSNFQFKKDFIDFQWMAEDGNWQGIVNAINEGVQVVEKIRAR